MSWLVTFVNADGRTEPGPQWALGKTCRMNVQLKCLLSWADDHLCWVPPTVVPGRSWVIRIKREIYNSAPKLGLDISRPQRPGPCTCQLVEAPDLCSGCLQQKHSPQPLVGSLFKPTATGCIAWTPPKVSGIARATSVSRDGLSPATSHPYPPPPQHCVRSGATLSLEVLLKGRQSLRERNLALKSGFSSWENRGSSSREAFLQDHVEGHSRAEALRIKCETVRGLLRGITGEEQQKTLFRTERASFPWITVSGTVLCTTFGTSIHQLRKIWIASSFRLLYHLILWLKKKLSLVWGPCYSYIFSGVRLRLGPSGSFTDPSKHLLSSFCVLGTRLDPGNPAVSKTQKVPAFLRLSL